LPPIAQFPWWLLVQPRIYAAKFLCGDLPAATPTGFEPPVQPGIYSTAINVHNPNRHAVTILKKAVLLFDASQKDPSGSQIHEVPRGPARREKVPVHLESDFGFEIDCPDIREVLLGLPPVQPTFIKGWVIIESPYGEPIDVVAVYTVTSREGHVSITTDRVLGTQVSAF
jgi:hypothetical protein